MGLGLIVVCCDVAFDCDIALDCDCCSSKGSTRVTGEEDDELQNKIDVKLDTCVMDKFLSFIIEQAIFFYLPSFHVFP